MYLQYILSKIQIEFSSKEKQKKETEAQICTCIFKLFVFKENFSMNVQWGAG